ncbi:hypothetical protein GPJ56_004033 [Histomonas meleagridis]|uniref:uncharacterized protein n=1 Tax=Histomonas meleagridis TaxID=135588 RepID=UPI003559DE11|nr:hypothetical protein GPJ56_004033 [Histomonas meleagridis]KAH0800612.1 hypothetical protein GO595_006365 [Histomonas meleagridis]
MFFLSFAILTLSLSNSKEKDEISVKKEKIKKRELLEEIYKKESKDDKDKEDEKSHKSDDDDDKEGFTGFMKSTPGVIMIIIAALLILFGIGITIYCLFRKNIISFQSCHCCKKKVDSMDQYGQVILDDSDDQEFILQPL